jgi:hypothetical protein
MTMKRMSIPALGLAALLAASCQPRVILTVPREAPELLPIAKAALAGHRGWGTVQAESEAVPKRALVVRLTTTPGLKLPGAALPLAEIPDDWRAGSDYALVGSLSRTGMGKDGKWRAIPLFFDAWGQTRFVAEGAKAPAPPDWDRLLARSVDKSLVMAGSRPSFRQWALLASASREKAGEGASASWLGLPSGPWRGELSALASLKHKSCWANNAWDFARPDFLQAYKGGSSLVFLETFRDFEGANVSGVRRFFPLQKEGPSGTALGGIVIFAELRGPADRWKAALPLLRYLASSGFQREVGSKTQWLAANYSAPELDGTGAAVRTLVRQAEAFYPLTDRLPDPLIEGNLPVDAQLAIDQAPRE